MGVYSDPMTQTIPASHVTVGARILVDGNSIAATVTNVQTAGDFVHIVCAEGDFFAVPDAELVLA